MKYGVMMQYFEWYLPPDCGLWKQLKERAAELAAAGITAVWMPPAYKGSAGNADVGYGVYDLYDLGEFDQKKTVGTKYGTKKEYLAAIKALQENGVDAYADIVLNHKMGADATELTEAVENASHDRNEVISDAARIRSWTKFTFPGRKGKYSDFVWNHTHFSGVDFDQKTAKTAIYNFTGHPWSSETDNENGSYDYLMGANVDFGNPEVVSHLKDWGSWYLETTGINGFRLDALKHIDAGFFPDWLQAMREYSGKELFAVGEYWKCDAGILKSFLERTGYCTALFDVPLHYNFYNASRMDGQFDMSKLLSGSLTEIEPVHSVTFVDNHDTQPGQSLDSSILAWFVMHAYCVLLLRTQGYPCIFYGDYYGLEARDGLGFKKEIDRLLKLRHHSMRGEQHDYFDDFNVVGWTFEGERADQGFAVIMTDSIGGDKEMHVGAAHAGQVWRDVLKNWAEDVVIDENGNGRFICIDGSVSVYAPVKGARAKQ